jgi:hypothetical protein
MSYFKVFSRKHNPCDKWIKKNFFNFTEKILLYKNTQSY